MSWPSGLSAYWGTSTRNGLPASGRRSLSYIGLNTRDAIPGPVLVTAALWLSGLPLRLQRWRRQGDIPEWGCTELPPAPWGEDAPSSEHPALPEGPGLSDCNPASQHTSSGLHQDAGGPLPLSQQRGEVRLRRGLFDGCVLNSASVAFAYAILFNLLESQEQFEVVPLLSDFNV